MPCIGTHEELCLKYFITNMHAIVLNNFKSNISNSTRKMLAKENVKTFISVMHGNEAFAFSGRLKYVFLSLGGSSVPHLAVHLAGCVTT